MGTVGEFLGDESMYPPDWKIVKASKELDEAVERLFPRMTPWRRLKRAIRYWYQRRVRGFDDGDIWNLDVEVAKFVLPRLRRLVEIEGESHFHQYTTPEEFTDMIKGLEEVIENDSTESDQSIQAWRTFAEVVRGMWW